MVSISTVRAGQYHDPACRLFPGDHPFITRESYVVYAMARIESADKISRGVTQNILVPKAPMDGSVFARICQGVLDSKHTPRHMKEFFRPIWEIS